MLKKAVNAQVAVRSSVGLLHRKDKGRNRSCNSWGAFITRMSQVPEMQPLKESGSTAAPFKRFAGLERGKLCVQSSGGKGEPGPMQHFMHACVETPGGGTANT